MKKLYETWPFNFGALHQQNFAKAKVVVVPTYYDSTSSYKSGMRDGPYAIIINSRFMDEMLEDKQTGGRLTSFAATDVYTLDEVVPSRNSAKEAVGGISQAIENEVLAHNKIPLMLGGEHSITLGAVEAVRKKYPDLSVLQFDAHTDLIDEHEGTRYSHACVMRRVLDLGAPVVQIGIRNMNTEISDYLAENPKQKNNIHFAPGLPSIEKVVKSLTKNVYLTFDLDAFDSSIMPSTGTPEPGGLYWHETIKFLENISQKINIVGADVVELMPIPGLHAPDFLAAKLVYKIISCVLNK